MSYLINQKQIDDLIQRIETVERRLSFIYPVILRNNYIITASDFRHLFICDGCTKIVLPEASSLYEGFHCFIKNNSEILVTVELMSTLVKIDKDNLKELSPNESLIIVCNGLNYFTLHAAAFISF